jgi:hypothetical protein
MKYEVRIHEQRKEKKHEAKDHRRASTTKTKEWGKQLQKDSIILRTAETYLHKVQHPMTKVLGLHSTKAFAFKRRELKNYKRS